MSAEGMLRFTTAGSVDDGKSSLIGRMLYDLHAVPRDRIAALERIARRKDEAEIDLSLLLDGLSAEREQGITIDVAYSHFATARRRFMIADTPGHEQYTRNMVTGASNADAAVILVDARRGMSVQTRRHLYLSHLLGVRHLVIAVNKMDLVDFAETVYAATAQAATEFAARLGASAPILVPISAKHGDNVVHPSARTPWYRGGPLLALLETLPAGDATRDAPFRMPVQLVRRIPTPAGGQKRQYLGRIESGHARIGDEIAVMPSGVATRIRALATFDGALDEAAWPLSVALETAEEIDIARGDILVASLARPQTATRFDATLCWFADESFTGRRSFLIKSGTRSVTGRIARIIHRVDVATLAA